MRFVAAGLLGLIVPGAGHAFLGRRRAALLFSVPVLALGGAVLVVYLTGGALGLVKLAVEPGVLPALAVLNVALAVWRLVAAADATRGSKQPATALGAVGAAALVLVLVPHAWAGVTISATNDLIDSVFGPDETADVPPDEEATDPATWVDLGWEGPVPHDPYAFGPTGTPHPTGTPRPRQPMTAGIGTLPGLNVAVPWDRPGATPWGSDGRFDLLLLGSDAGADRWSRRMDVMLLVEVDVATGKVAMIGLPRNLYGAPYPPGSAAANAVACGCFQDLLNAMYVEATVVHPGWWPGTGAVKGIGAVRSMVGTLTGRPIDAVLVADLWGVIKVVDAMGGIDIDVPAAVHDDHYPDPIYGSIVLDIPAGHHHLDGRLTLAYSRSRHQDSDYSRMLRQQTMLLAIRDEIGPATILRAPALAAAAKGFVWTDVPRSALPNLVDLFAKADSASVKQLRIVPPTYPAYLTTSEVTRIRTDIARLLGVPAPTPLPSPAASPTPTPTPTAAPSATAQSSPSTGPSATPKATAMPPTVAPSGGSPPPSPP